LYKETLAKAGTTGAGTINADTIKNLMGLLKKSGGVNIGW
jgi:hypothetical protein